MSQKIIADKKVGVLLSRMRDGGLKIVTAESLTCGWIAATMARISGASDVVEGGFAVYNNRMKHALLGVPWETLDQYTAVSAQVALAMAEGALGRTGSNIAVAVTGYAGSTGGNAPDSDAGLVYIGLAWQFDKAAAVRAEVHQHQFPGTRNEARIQTVNAALGHVGAMLKANGK